jgi:hypothetical protein
LQEFEVLFLLEESSLPRPPKRQYPLLARQFPSIFEVHRGQRLT